MCSMAALDASVCFSEEHNRQPLRFVVSARRHMSSEIAAEISTNTALSWRQNRTLACRNSLEIAPVSNLFCFVLSIHWTILMVEEETEGYGGKDFFLAWNERVRG